MESWCNPICLFSCKSNLLLCGLFNQTCRQPNTIDSQDFKGGLRWLLFYFNDITYLSPVCVSIYFSRCGWDRKFKWKSSFAGYQGKAFLSFFPRRGDWNASRVPCLNLTLHERQVGCETVRVLHVLLCVYIMYVHMLLYVCISRIDDREPFLFKVLDNWTGSLKAWHYSSTAPSTSDEWKYSMATTIRYL